MKKIALFSALLTCVPPAHTQYNTTCQRIYNGMQCNTTGGYIQPSVPAPDIAGTIARQQQAQAAQQAALAAQLQAQTNAILARRQAELMAEQTRIAREQANALEAQRETSTAAPGASDETNRQEPVAPSNIQGGDPRLRAAAMAAQAKSEDLQKAIPTLEHLCETTGDPTICAGIGAAKAELEYRAKHPEYRP